MATSIIKEKANRMKIETYVCTVNNGFCQIPYPDGYGLNDEVVIIPSYLSTGLLGWSAAVQRGDTFLNLYIRQGTTLPANGSKVSFHAIFIKAYPAP